MYEQLNMEKLSNKEKSISPHIASSGMLKGFYSIVDPKHRFTDYSKAQIDIKIYNSAKKEGIELDENSIIKPVKR